MNLRRLNAGHRPESVRTIRRFSSAFDGDGASSRSGSGTPSAKATIVRVRGSLTWKARAISRSSGERGRCWRDRLVTGHARPGSRSRSRGRSSWRCLLVQRLGILERGKITAFDAAVERLVVLALDRKTGRTIWRREVRYETLGDVHATSTPATATPVVDTGRVYVYFPEVGLLAYDLDGRPAWSVSLPFAQTTFGSGTSHVLAGNRLFLNRDSVVDPFFMAIDRRSGQVLWRVTHETRPRGSSGHATPVIVADQVLLHRSGKIVSFEVGTGERRWWVNANGGGVSTPAVVGKMAYVGTWSALGEEDKSTRCRTSRPRPASTTKTDRARSIAQKSTRRASLSPVGPTSRATLARRLAYPSPCSSGTRTAS